MLEVVRYLIQLLVISALLIGRSHDAIAAASDLDLSASTRSGEAIELGHRALLLYERRDYRLALDLFGQADQLMHSPVFVLYQARSAAALGELVRALALFERCASEKLDETSPVAWSSAVQSAQLAHRRLAQLVPQAEFRISGEVAFPIEFTIVRSQGQSSLASDDRRVEEAPRKVPDQIDSRTSIVTTTVDAGVYEVTASDASGSKVSQTWRATQHSKVHIEFVFSDEARLNAAGSMNSAKSTSPHSTSSLRWGAYAAFGSGGALTLSSLIAGGLAINLAHKVRAQCDDGTCPASEMPHARRAFSCAQFSTAMFVSGMIGIGTGLGLFIVDLKQGKTKARMDLQIESNGLNLQGSF